MRDEDQKSGIARITHGDERQSRELRANLAVFARRSTNAELRKLVAEVLAGRRDVNEVFHTRQFQLAVSRNLDRIEAGIAALTDEQRAEVFDQHRPRTPQHTLDAMRDEAVAGKPPFDPAAVLAEPDEPDNDQRETFMNRPRGR